jgi:hypothetical protein
VSTGFKKKEFKLTPQVLFRLLIFSIFIYFLISYLSNSKPQLPQINDTPVLGENTSMPVNPPQLKVIYDQVYNQIPPDSRRQLETINQSPVIISLQEKLTQFQNETNNFPQKQIVEIKKTIIQNVYQNLMNSVEQGK